ncbi:alpha/beta fold family hydrolase [Streptococcus pneumoniae]|nr:hypothetical protein [Streptococcus pneumoniae]CMY76485.1 alpha/beta fold family hydrolase [Streptococcus pneumoniae]
MKRFEVSTEIGSLSVTYQKQKKVLVCLNGAGLLPSYENFSLILEKPPPTIGYLTLACKLLEKPIKRQTLVAIEPTTKKSCLLIF